MIKLFTLAIFTMVFVSCSHQVTPIRTVPVVKHDTLTPEMIKKIPMGNDELVNEEMNSRMKARPVKPIKPPKHPVDTIVIVTPPDTIPPPPPQPVAQQVIYIDMNGQVVTNQFWNNGQTLVCAATVLTTEQNAEILARVRFHYDSCNVFVTMDETAYNNADPNTRIRVIVTPTSYWRTGVSGITYNGSFNWGNNTPCFVFSDRLYNHPRMIAEIITHETGHSFGLNHQSEYDSNCQLVATYRMGVIMGNSLYVPDGGTWTTGPTLICTLIQNDMEMLSNNPGLK